MDFSDLINKLSARGEGLVLFTFPISVALLNDFPIPQTSTVKEFLNFSEDANLENLDARTFDQRRHLYRISSLNTLTMACIGLTPAIYRWAEAWLENLQKDPRYTSCKKATLLFGEDLIAPVEEKPVNPDIFHGTELAYTDDELEANLRDTTRELNEGKVIINTQEIDPQGVV